MAKLYTGFQAYEQGDFLRAAELLATVAIIEEALATTLTMADVFCVSALAKTGATVDVISKKCERFSKEIETKSSSVLSEALKNDAVKHALGESFLWLGEQLSSEGCHEKALEYLSLAGKLGLTHEIIAPQGESLFQTGNTHVTERNYPMARSYLERIPEGHSHYREAQELMVKMVREEKKKKKTLVVVVAGLLASVIAGVFLFNWVADGITWKNAALANTIEQYQLYIEQHSQGRFTTNALTAIEEITWHNALGTNTTNAYSKYLSKYKSGRYTEIAKYKIDSITSNIDARYWEKTQLVNNVRGYLDYMKNGTNNMRMAVADSILTARNNEVNFTVSAKQNKNFRLISVQMFKNSTVLTIVTNVFVTILKNRERQAFRLSDKYGKMYDLSSTSARTSNVGGRVELTFPLSEFDDNIIHLLSGSYEKPNIEWSLFNIRIESLGPVENTDRAFIYQRLNGNPVFRGEAWTSQNKWPFLLYVKSLNEATGAWTGQINWISLYSIHKIEGKFTTNRVTFTEVSVIKKGRAAIGCRYALTPEEDAFTLRGTWECQGNGGVWMFQ